MTVVVPLLALAAMPGNTGGGMAGDVSVVVVSAARTKLLACTHRRALHYIAALGISGNERLQLHCTCLACDDCCTQYCNIRQVCSSQQRRNEVRRPPLVWVHALHDGSTASFRGYPFYTTDSDA